MDNYTAAQIREEFIEPLAELVIRLTDDARRLENAAASGDLRHDYLPLNATMARKAVAQLRRFARQEIHLKLEAAIEGSLKFREHELARMREKYRQKKETDSKK